MTSTPTAPPGRRPVVPQRPGSGPARPATTSAPPRTGSSLGDRLRRTPSRLRLAIGVSLIASLLVSVVGLLVGTLTASTTASVVDRVDSILELQDARSALVSANGTASNAFLVGGLEPTAQRETYDLLLADGAATIASLAASDADRAGDLSPVAATLTTYSGLIEQARANNRQGFPVGAAYLDTASVLLQAEVLPPLDDAIVANADAAASDLNTVGAYRALLWVAVLAVVILVGIQVWLARRTRRTLNPAMLIGSGLVLVAWVACLVATDSAHSRLDETRSDSYAATLATSQALSLAGEARTAESFGLIQRGSGQAYEEQFVAAMTGAQDQLARPAVIGYGVSNDLQAWNAAHAEIRALDDAGDWDGAVELATSAGPDSPNALYETFVATATDEVAALSQETRDGFGSATTSVTVTSWALVAAGVACALLSWRGINKRLEEYR